MIQPKSKDLLISLAVFLLLELVYISCAQCRLIDGDEGFYVLAAKLVFSGKVLYQDFVFNQVPGVPYLYGLWMNITEVTWKSARLFSALLAAATGCLLFHHFRSQTKSLGFSFVCAILFASSTLIFSWYTVVKTYALSVFLLLLATHFASSAKRTSHSFLAGLFLGLSISTRLFFAAVFPVFIIWILLKADSNRSKHLQSLIAGTIIGLIPIFIFLIIDYQSTVFSTFTYHSLRSEAGLIGAIGQKVKILLGLLVREPQLIILLIISFLSLVFSKAKIPLSFFVGITLFCVSFLPTPSFMQYFCTTVPFFILTATFALREVTLAFLKFSRFASAVLLLSILTVYLLPVSKTFSRYMETGEFVIGVDKPVNYQLPTVSKISDEIDSLLDPGDPLISWWPGYAVESEAEPLEGTELHMARLEMPERMSIEERRKLHIISPNELKENIRKQSAKVIVLGNWTLDRQENRKIILDSGYTLRKRIGDAEIYALAKD